MQSSRIFISYSIIVYFYDNNYENALIPIIIMFVTTGFITVNNVVGQAIASKGKMWLGFYFNLIWAIVLVVFCYLMIVQFQLGAIGLAFSYLISYILHTVLQFFYLRKIVVF